MSCRWKSLTGTYANLNTHTYIHTQEIQRSSNNVSDWSETNAWGQAVSKVMVDFWHGHRVTCNSVGSVATRSQAVFGPSQVVTRIFGVVESRCNQDGAKIEPRWGQVWLRRGQDGVKLCQDGVKRDVVRMRRRMKTLMATSPQTSGSQSTERLRRRGGREEKRRVEERRRGRGEEKRGVEERRRGWLGLTQSNTVAVIHHPDVLGVPFLLPQLQTKAKLTYLSSVFPSHDPMILKYHPINQQQVTLEFQVKRPLCSIRPGHQ